jgi:hypothetical protein
MLRKFDRLTKMLSSIHQTVRMDARFKYVPEFVAKHGQGVCDEMFKVLQERDHKKEEL